MEQSLSAWLLPAVALVVGVIIGYLLANVRAMSANGGKRNDTLQQQFDAYQGDVVNHLNATAGLMQRLNQNLHDLQEHLSEGAAQLTPDEQTRQRLMVGLSEPSYAPRERLPLTTARAEAPRDYAPGNSGTLDSSTVVRHN
ncbi:MAG: YhcB family protein [Pseudomonas sp.]